MESIMLVISPIVGFVASITIQILKYYKVDITGAVANYIMIGLSVIMGVVGVLLTNNWNPLDILASVALCIGVAQLCYATFIKYIKPKE